MRAQGALYGLAIGDALGMPTQMLSRALAGAAAVAAAVSAGVSGAGIARATALAVQAARLAAGRGHWVAGADVAARIDWATHLVAGRDETEAAELIYTLVGTSLATQESVPAAFAVLAAVPDDPWRACLLAAPGRVRAGARSLHRGGTALRGRDMGRRRAQAGTVARGRERLPHTRQSRAFRLPGPGSGGAEPDPVRLGTRSPPDRQHGDSHRGSVLGSSDRGATTCCLSSA